MTGLAKIVFSISQFGGLCLKSGSSLLFPIRIPHDSASKQPHRAASANPTSRLPTRESSPNGEDVLVKHYGLKDLVLAGRTFLGCCRSIDIRLGMQNSRDSFGAPTYSQAGDGNPAPGLTPTSVTIDTSGMGIWGF